VYGSTYALVSNATDVCVPRYARDSSNLTTFGGERISGRYAVGSAEGGGLGLTVAGSGEARSSGCGGGVLGVHGLE